MGENCWLEFHDSTAHGIRRDGPDAVLEMSVYVHSSAGRPGIDAGVGWYQAAEVRVSGATVIDAGSLGALRVVDGTVTVDGDRFENGVPLPFERSGAVVRDEPSGVERAVVVRGNGTSVVLTGRRDRSSGSGNGRGRESRPCARGDEGASSSGGARTRRVSDSGSMTR